MTDINQLSAVSSVSSGDQVPVWSTGNGDTRRVPLSVLLAYLQANLGDAAGTSLVLTKQVKTIPVAVAALPAAAANAGARAAVTDATQTLTAGIGAVVVGGGANVVPVFSDGVNWRIGG